jgi:hypothetical protein
MEASMAGITPRWIKKEVLADGELVEAREDLRERAKVYGGEGAAQIVESMPTMSSAEVISFAFGEDGHAPIVEAARNELLARMAILDEMLAAHRAQNLRP